VSVTVSGIASKVGGIAAHCDDAGRIIGAHSYRSLALELPRRRDR
jgi:hypothetical protein